MIKERILRLAKRAEHDTPNYFFYYFLKIILYLCPKLQIIFVITIKNERCFITEISKNSKRTI